MRNSGPGLQTLGNLFSRCLRGAAGLAASIGLAAAAVSAFAAAERCDVVVIGAGGSGLTSALSAAESGAKVVVVEKMPFIGGNTVLATGFMLGVPRGDRREAEQLESDMIRKGGRTASKALLSQICHGLGRSRRMASRLRRRARTLLHHARRQPAGGLQPQRERSRLQARHSAQARPHRSGSHQRAPARG